MTTLFHAVVPQAPSWRLDWQDLHDAFGWIRALSGVPQDPVFHAEGDVWIHTRLVCEALVEDPEWRALPEPRRALIFWGALLHDVAKPACTLVGADGRVTAPGHSRRGQIMARRLLWQLGVPPAEREFVCHLVTHHQVPFFLLEREHPQRLAFTVSLQTECRALSLLTRADARGRDCPDKAHLLENIELFQEYCRENACFEGPRRFPSDHSRFLYFRKPGRSPDYLAFDDTRSTVVLMSGLPASGKDHWIERNSGDMRVISLDALRSEMQTEADAHQGPVVARAREQARAALGHSENFVWNATSLSRQIRAQCIDLFAAYNARIKIVCVETTPDDLTARNRARPDPVPAKALDRMFDRWECPDLTECHELTVVSN